MSSEVSRSDGSFRSRERIRQRDLELRQSGMRKWPLDIFANRLACSESLKGYLKNKKKFAIKHVRHSGANYGAGSGRGSNYRSIRHDTTPVVHNVRIVDVVSRNGQNKIYKLQHMAYVRWQVSVLKTLKACNPLSNNNNNSFFRKTHLWIADEATCGKFVTHHVALGELREETGGGSRPKNSHMHSHPFCAFRRKARLRTGDGVETTVF